MAGPGRRNLGETLGRHKELVLATVFLLVAGQEFVEIWALERFGPSSARFWLGLAQHEDQVLAILAAVRVVLEGGSVIDPRLLSRVVEAVAAEPGPPPASWATAEPLTPLERQVLTLVTHGLTNREAADRLGCSVGTVKKYVQRIIEKLQVTDRTQAAVEAVRRGLIRDFHLPPGSPPAEP